MRRRPATSTPPTNARWMRKSRRRRTSWSLCGNQPVRRVSRCRQILISTQVRARREARRRALRRTAYLIVKRSFYTAGDRTLCSSPLALSTRLISKSAICLLRSLTRIVCSTWITSGHVGKGEGERERPREEAGALGNLNSRKWPRTRRASTGHPGQPGAGP